MYDYLHTEPKKLMFIGPFDDDLAKTVAAYAGLPDIGILQVKVPISLFWFNVSLERFSIECSKTKIITDQSQETQTIQ